MRILIKFTQYGVKMFSFYTIFNSCLVSRCCGLNIMETDIC